jgi:hypothetical protein
MECGAAAAAAAASHCILRGIKLWQVAAQLGVPAASIFARPEQAEYIPEMSNENMVSFFFFAKHRGFFME